MDKRRKVTLHVFYPRSAYEMSLTVLNAIIHYTIRMLLLVEPLLLPLPTAPSHSLHCRNSI